MNELEQIAQLLRETAELVRRKYRDRANLQVAAKRHPNDLVTETDWTVQDYIVRRIQDAYPGDVFAAEEGEFSKITQGETRRCWVIDPIDGTQNYVRGLLPAFGISIAFSSGGRAVAGGVAIPLLDQVYLAELGSGAMCNGAPVRVSGISRAATARLEVDFSGPPERAEILRRAQRLIRGTGQIRCNCASVVSLCAIAAGEADAFFHVRLNPWDYAAALLIVHEAGGRSSRLDGSPVELFDGRRGMLATNGLIHDELLALVDP